MMQPNTSRLHLIWRIARKETSLFFASPIAYLFLATFAAVTLFVFFWGEAFFARNISDVRPLFEWMPILLIFLASTLTMRLWSEERRTGTLEHVLTQPTPLWLFVAGKFLACLSLLCLALLITLPLPITVAILGDLDWGPVITGYLATLLLGAAYLSIGLFVSARSDNQIVSLISASALCGLFYLLGTNTITDFFGNRAGEWFRLIGTGSRFDAITRGVIDLRDLYYYACIVLVFLALNTFTLERERWACGKPSSQHTLWRTLSLLFVLNAIAANFWLGQVKSARLDATQGNIYSISDASKSYLDQLQEPLLMRGYFSSKTHPLLSPLVPQLRDLMREYEVAGHGKVRVEFIDPMTQPELEQEANEKFGIRPVPFQVADRYQSSIVSSYFNVLIQYGDEFQVLAFRDLIEVNVRSEADVEVTLRNPEYDLTSAIRQALNSYRASGNVFDTIDKPIVFNAYVSDSKSLPAELNEYKKRIESVLQKVQQEAGEKLKINFIDPLAGNGEVAEQIAKDYGFQPMATSLFSTERFYFYLTLSQGQQVIQIPFEEPNEANFERNFYAALKRFASGFIKTVALVTPEVDPRLAQYGMSGPQFNQLESFIGGELNVKREDISDGRVSGDTDILLVLAPKELDNKQVFAIDQFLMQGGTLVLASSPFNANISNQGLNLEKHVSGLEAWLASHGLTIEEQLVLDPQNAAFPIPVTRQVGGFQMQEMRMIDYPYFIDLREEGLNQDNPISSDLPQLSVPWASPISVDEEKQTEHTRVHLLQSSEGSWLSSSTDIMPRVDSYGLSEFKPEGEVGSQLIGLISTGRFNSFFSGKTSPLLDDTSEDNQSEPEAENDAESETHISSIIERSPNSARIILFASNELLSDRAMQLASSTGGTQYLNSLQLVANSIDWSLEDAGLLSIRSRGHFNRTLPPMEKKTQTFWEYLNYALALIGLIIIAVTQRQRRLAKEKRYLASFAQQDGV